MNFNYRTIAMALAAVAITCIPAFGQTDLLKGRDASTEIRPDLYSHAQSGNQDMVREYDGRLFDGWGFDYVNTYGYEGDYQYWLEGRDLKVGDEDVSLALGVKNQFSLAVNTDAMLHRLPRRPQLDPYLAPFGLATLTPGPPIAVAGNAFVDMTPTGVLGIQRRVNDYGVRLTPGAGRLALVADWWEETENGLQQANYRSLAKRLESVDFAIDRRTEQANLGADLQIGGGTVVNYGVESNQFTGSGSHPVIPGDQLGKTRVPDIKTSSNIIKVRSRLSNHLYFTGAHTNRTRSNETETASAGNSIGTNSTNAALTFMASGSLSLCGRYRDYEVDNNISPVLDTAGRVTNVGLSRREQALELDADYTGIRKALIRLGYERRRNERELGRAFPPDPDLEDVMEPVTTSNILTASISYHPTPSLSLSGKLQNWDNDKPAFTSSPDTRRNTNLDITYLVTDNLAVYADYNGQHDGRKDPDGLDNKFNTTVFGAWYGLAPKITLDASYANVSTDAKTLWQPGGVTPEDVPYKTTDKQYSVGLTCIVAPRTTMYGRYLVSNSVGKTTLVTLIPGSPALPDGWMPVKVNQKQWTFGFARDISAKDRLYLDFTYLNWTDKIDSGQTGAYTLWRMGYSTSY